MNITDTFQTRLKQAMIKTGMRQIEVCRLTGISQSLLNKYLKGIADAKQGNLKKLSKALNVSPVWLMGYDVPMTLESERHLQLREEIKSLMHHASEHQLEKTLQYMKDIGINNEDSS